MQTRREYAAGLGLAKAGARGRLSKPAHEAILEAEKNGMVFSDSPNRGKSVSEIEDSADQPKAVSVAASFGSTPEPFWNGGWYYIENGKHIPVSGNAACGKCRFSLDYQACREPIAVNNRGDLVAVMR